MTAPTQSTTRRDFIKTSAATTGAMALPLWYRKSQGQDDSPAKPGSPNDRINIGSIGTSIYTNRYTGEGDHPGRGAVVGHQAASLGNMVAVADCNLRNARFFAKDYDGKCEVYQDYHKLLDRQDIDAVTIGTPDHWHVQIAIEALRAGKHVYCEKPLSLTVEEGQQVCKVAEETGKAFQVGSQQRDEYGRIFLKAVALARSGRLGDKLHALVSVGEGESGGPFENSEPPQELDWNMWLGHTPEVPYCEHRADYEFRWWLEYSGGQVTDWGVHHMDIALWAMNLGDTGPQTIEGTGHYPDIENGYDVATTFDCNFTFEGGHTARLYSGKNELIISGDKGKIRVNRGGLTGKPVEELTEKDNDWLEESMTELCHGKLPSGQTGETRQAGSHMQNFFDCIKAGGKCISDPWTHHRSVSVCHIANIAMILGRKLEFDPKKEVFPNDEEATAMLSRPRREGFEINV